MNKIDILKEKLNYFPRDLEIEWEQYGTYNIRYNLNCKLYLNVIDLFSYYGYRYCDFYNEYYDSFIELLKMFNYINDFLENQKDYINIDQLDESKILILSNIKRLYEQFPKRLKFNEQELYFDYDYLNNNKIYLNINDLIINNDSLYKKEEGKKLGKLLSFIIYFINNFNNIYKN